MSDETLLGKFGKEHKIGLLAYLPIFYCINTQIPKNTEKFQSIHFTQKTIYYECGVQISNTTAANVGLFYVCSYAEKSDNIPFCSRKRRTKK